LNAAFAMEDYAAAKLALNHLVQGAQA
jgi:hypothetical protein